jgi:glucokinase
LGGTHVRAAYFDGTSRSPARQIRHQTPQVSQSLPVLEAIARAIREVLPSPEAAAPAAIAIGTPGPVDPFRGVVLSAPNIPAWHDLPLREWLAQRFPATIHIANDANLAALGELMFGAGRGSRELLYLTLGTGIGGAVISDGRLLLGRRGLATELGHVTVLPDGPLCSCGQAGHIEAIASGPAIARRARQRLGRSAIEISSMYAADPLGQHLRPSARLPSRRRLRGWVPADVGRPARHYIADCLPSSRPSA